MVAASKLRRAQERILDARPFAAADARGSSTASASRVDPSLHPLLRRPEIGGRQPDAARGHHGRQGAVRQLQHEHHQGAPASFIAREPRGARSRSAWSAARGATSSRAAGSPCCFETVELFHEAALRATRRRIAQRRDRRRSPAARWSGVYLAYNEFKSVMQQRVVVEQLLPIPRAGHRAGRAPPAQRGLPVRAVAAGDLRRRCCRAHVEIAGLPRAARVERRRSTRRR